MIEINELIVYFCGELQPHPPETPLSRHDVAVSTLAYLNGYRMTNVMLQSLAGKTAEFETEARLLKCGDA